MSAIFRSTDTICILPMATDALVGQTGATSSWTCHIMRHSLRKGPWMYTPKNCSPKMQNSGKNIAHVFCREQLLRVLVRLHDSDARGRSNTTDRTQVDTRWARDGFPDTSHLHVPVHVPGRSAYLVCNVSKAVEPNKCFSHTKPKNQKIQHAPTLALGLRPHRTLRMKSRRASVSQVTIPAASDIHSLQRTRPSEPHHV